MDEEKAAKLRRDAWDKYSIWANWGFVILLIAILALTGIAAAPDTSKWWAIGGTGMTGLMAALQPRQIGIAYREAWVHLDGAIIMKRPDLGKAIHEGQEILKKRLPRWMGLH